MNAKSARGEAHAATDHAREDHHRERHEDRDHERGVPARRARRPGPSAVRKACAPSDERAEPGDERDDPLDARPREGADPGGRLPRLRDVTPRVVEDRRRALQPPPAAPPGSAAGSARMPSSIARRSRSTLVGRRAADLDVLHPHARDVLLRGGVGDAEPVGDDLERQARRRRGAARRARAPTAARRRTRGRPRRRSPTRRC